MEKILSCCGMICSDCEYYPTDCRGCGVIKGKVFWLEYTGEDCCEIYNCCVKQRKYKNCGRCEELPCSRYERGDPTKTTEENAADHSMQVKNLEEHRERENIADDLQKVPGIGKNIMKHLQAIGIRCVNDLIGKDPEELYRLDCMQKGFQEDRCQLYVFRCAVYYAEHKKHDSKKLKWWYWKDKDYPEK